VLKICFELVEEAALMLEEESRSGARAVDMAAVEVVVDAKVPIPKTKPEVVAKASAGPKIESVAFDMVKAASKASKTLVAPTIEQLVKLATIHTIEELASIVSASHFGSRLEGDPETKHSLEAVDHKCWSFLGMVLAVVHYLYSRGSPHVMLVTFIATDWEA